MAPAPRHQDIRVPRGAHPHVFPPPPTPRHDYRHLRTPPVHTQSPGRSGRHTEPPGSSSTVQRGALRSSTELCWRRRSDHQESLGATQLPSSLSPDSRQKTAEGFSRKRLKQSAELDCTEKIHQTQGALPLSPPNAFPGVSAAGYLPTPSGAPFPMTGQGLLSEHVTD
ncbi:hypothetical protein Anapl_03217 [Anas platyrhynchos]|uniref:Uncharacterized protein n=1 Tax=Anas platyrhynchos TaxID=8839 RepID=R0L852_ANAPL|nr:hypothetical protein Anapl_03217 [Anas platyrhynchos]